MPDFSPDGAANGHPEPNSNPAANPAPRIAPPAGARIARGEALDDASTPEPGDFEAPSDFAAPSDFEAPAMAVSVEDSYDPPLDFGGDGDQPAPNGPALTDTPLTDTPRDVELGLMQHLAELRQRLLYCALILMAGMTLTWNFAKPLQKWFADPIIKVLKENGRNGELVSYDPTGFFSVTVQFSLVSALIIAAPLLFWQIWLFIEPALTKNERRYSLVVIPFSSALFFLGAALSYAVSPLFFKFFLAFQPEDVAAKWDYYQSILLMAKMLLAFGIMFQVPVIIIFLNKLGILSRNVLIDYWRHAVIVIFTVAAIVTPTWDPVTLVVCATPPCLLYILSIWLVKWL